MKKKVYICAPLTNDMVETMAQIRVYVEYALQCGVAPVVPHFYWLCMSPDTTINAEILRSASRSLLWYCDEMWIFGDEVTEQMTSDLQFCKDLHLRTKRIRSLKVPKQPK